MSNQITLNLQKSISLNLTKEFSTLNRLTMGLGWDMAVRGQDWDLDSIAVALDKNGDIVQTVYFGDKDWSRNGIQLDKDNLTGEGEGADENIFVQLDKVPANVVKIGFFANIYNAGRRDFSGVKNAFINITDNDTGKEIAIYHLNEEGKGFNAFHFGSLDKANGEWLFTPIGEGTNGSVNTVATTFSKQVKASLGITQEEQPKVTKQENQTPQEQSQKKKGFFGRFFS